MLLLDGTPVDPPPSIVRRGPGVWVFTWKPPPGLGGSRATFGATFDGVPIVTSHTVPIAADGWDASYPSHATGSACSAGATGARSGAGAASAGAGASAMVIAMLLARRRRTPSA